MADDKIISIQAGVPSARLKSLDWSDKRARCEHRHIEVWAKEPIIECADCGAVVDPYVWLRKTIAHWESMVATQNYKVKEAKEEMAELKSALRVLRGEFATEAEKHKAKRAVMVMPPPRRHG